MLNILRKNKKIILTVILFFSVVLLLIVNNKLFSNDQSKEENKITKVCIEKNCFNVEIADTAQEREIGLMNRKFLALDSGMLFVFEKEGVYKFWMKNTLIPLDIIWIDKNRKIIFIKENASPCKIDICETFGPNEKAKYILEINGGVAEKMGLGVGDLIKIR
ncbi:hypothetical protein GQ568_01910 [Patescibacteria group bacterium]|nr:hypothetical protein [Patescibacteria group bacterium]